LLGKKQDIKLQNSHLKIVTYKINVWLIYLFMDQKYTKMLIILCVVA
jgi:hypothetical protein